MGGLSSLPEQGDRSVQNWPGKSRHSVPQNWCCLIAPKMSCTKSRLSLRLQRGLQQEQRGSAVAAGANCSISVTFIPTATGTRTGAITISDNASDSLQMVNLTGTGTSGGVPGTIGFVQARGNGTNATTNTVLINTTASNDVIVVVAFATTTPRVTSVSDTGGSTYTRIHLYIDSSC